VLDRFFPDVALNSFEDITPGFLKKKGIKALLLDIDNTLVPYATRIPEERTHKWFKVMKDNGIKICIMSNAREKRVKLFAEGLEFTAVHNARKPGRASFRRVLQQLGLKAKEVAMVGDQIFTDIWGGKRSGLYTILVKPIDKKENIFIRAKRLLEIPVLICYKIKSDK
jgi:HAD superfamily phosphatase (TIGR01668 family)